MQELCHEHDHDRDAGDEGAESVDECVFAPVRTAVLPPMHHHSGLRQSEGEKCADGVERDETVSDALEKNQQRGAEHGQNDDAIGVDQAASAVSENVRQVVILRDGAAESREIGEGGVGGEREHDQDGSNREVIKGAFAKNRGNEHGEQTLIAWPAGIGRGDAINVYQIGDSRQQHGQQKNNYGKSPLRVLDGGLAKSLDAVADSLDASECCATAGKDFQQQPITDGFGHGQRRRKSSYRRGVASAEQNTGDADDNRDEQGAEKKIGGHGEGKPGLADSAEIENGNYDQNADAQRNGMGQQGRDSRHQRSDARGNSNRSGENVVGKKRGGGKEARPSAEIKSRDGVRAAARGIGGDGLAIGEIDNQQQRDDRGANGNDVMNAEQSERNQQAEGSFRSVGRRTQGVESEDRDALRHADLFATFLAGLDGLADNKVNNIHGKLGAGLKYFNELSRVSSKQPFARFEPPKKTRIIRERQGWGLGAKTSDFSSNFSHA